MIGVILIAASWFLLRLEKKPLSELGFDQPWKRTKELGIGLLVAALFATARYLAAARVGEFAWVRSPDVTWGLVIESLRFNTNSVLYEELTFRGYLLYKAIGLLGRRRGCLVSAAAFGIYHWFSYEIVGEPVPMAFVFVLTGTFGLALAHGFARTGSLALPVGLHFGWNFVGIFVFSDGPLGAQLFVPDSVEGAAMQGTPWFVINTVLSLSLPALVLWRLARTSEP